MAGQLRLFIPAGIRSRYAILLALSEEDNSVPGSPCEDELWPYPL